MDLYHTPCLAQHHLTRDYWRRAWTQRHRDVGLSFAQGTDHLRDHILWHLVHFLLQQSSPLKIKNAQTLESWFEEDRSSKVNDPRPTHLGDSAGETVRSIGLLFYSIRAEKFCNPKPKPTSATPRRPKTCSLSARFFWDTQCWETLLVVRHSTITRMINLWLEHLLTYIRTFY